MKKENKNNINIEKTMTFAEIMEKKPEAAGVLMKAGMHCFGCAMAGGETLEEGCLAHGLNPEKILREINKLRVNKKK